MGVITKPDLAIETAIKKIAIDHVAGKSRDLTMGYHIVKNRGLDDTSITFEKGQMSDNIFFSTKPWSSLKRTGRVGNESLKTKVRTLLANLVKSEFKKLRSEIDQKLQRLLDKERAMGPSRSDPNAQRAYLGNLCDQSQSITRNALSGNYTQNADFFSQESHRLITRIVELDEQFATGILEHGHTRPFTNKENPGPAATLTKSDKNKFTVVLPEPAEPMPAVFDSFGWGPSIKKKKTSCEFDMDEPVDPEPSDLEPLGPETEPGPVQPKPIEPKDFWSQVKSRPRVKKNTVAMLYDSVESTMKMADVFPVLNKLPVLQDCESLQRFFKNIKSSSDSGENIMQYIRKVYTNSRSADLGTFNGSLLAAISMEQSKNWEALMKAYIKIAISLVESFLKDVIGTICPDSQVKEELCEVVLPDHVFKCFVRAYKHSESLLNMERGCAPWTLNHYFNDNLSKNQGGRLITSIKKIAGVVSEDLKSSGWFEEQEEYTLTEAQLQSIATHNQSNVEHMQDYIHDVLKSYYKVAIKRFIDNISLHVVHHDMLYAENGPLNVFSSKFVHSLDEDQWDQLAGESSLVKMEREKLAQDIKNFRAALGVLKGTPVKVGYPAAGTDY